MLLSKTSVGALHLKNTLLFLIPCSNNWMYPKGTASDSSKHDNKSASDDFPVSMENPYKSFPERCTLCGVKVDYKNVQLLSQFVSSFTGLRLPPKITPLCERKYKEVTRAIQLSRKAGLMPYTLKETTFLDDPVLTSKQSFKS
ncbi:small ribosomal subunit protein bS18m-like [Clavelina lepadiformis]|uniref:Mitochondrial ribosomal protein S18C n=1 Tax=Clavelina lepadiformis TaxID=159417 RepID=A0ABP0GVD5_CLALP